MNELEEVDKVVVETKKYCCFSFGDNHFAISLDEVKEIVPAKTLSFLPHVPEYILGAFNVRGQVFCAIDLSRFFSLESSNSTHGHQFQLLIDDEEVKISFLLGEIPKTISVEDKELDREKVSKTLKSKKLISSVKGFVSSGGEIYSVLDISYMLSNDLFVSQTDNLNLP